MTKDIKRFRRRLARKADCGDVDAMMKYCATYPEAELRTAKEEVRKRVLRYLRTAARKGNADALCNLGAAYYGSCLVRRDFAKAVKYYEASAAKGCVQAMSNLGYCHYYGRDIPVDFGKAFQWFLKAYIMGGGSLPETCYKLGDCYRNGRGVDRDDILAFRLYRQAYNAAWCPDEEDFREIEHGWDCELMGADAALRLGSCFAGGVGCERDLKEAEEYFRIAVAGFRRKAELCDEFAPALLESAQRQLQEVRDKLAGKRKRLAKQFSLECEIVGLSHVRDLAKAISGVKRGDKVSLIRDPGNAYDANAIAVATADGRRIGWIPRALNAEAAARMDRGEALSATISAFDNAGGRESISLSVTNQLSD